MDKKKAVYVPTVGEEIGNAVSHGVMSLLSLLALPFAAVWAYAHDPGGVLASVSVSVFVISIFLMFLASTLYHSMNPQSKHKEVFHILDHIFIYVAIAGSYTPICLITLRGPQGTALCAAVWAVALAGIAIKALWITCPKWFSSLIYIAMGWVCVLAITKILDSMPKAGFMWLLTGGIIYTVGGIIYALKLPFFNSRHKYFGSHEIFHLFVMGGSICHYVMMYRFVA